MTGKCKICGREFTIYDKTKSFNWTCFCGSLMKFTPSEFECEVDDPKMADNFFKYILAVRGKTYVR